MTGSDLASRFGLARDDDALGSAAIGMGLDLATDPLSYLGVGAAHHALAGGKEASRFSSVRGLRQPLGLVKDLGGDTERVIGGARGLADHLKSSWADLAQEVPSDVEGMMLSPWNRQAADKGMAGTGFTLGRDPGSRIAREEILHGMTKHAAVNGGEENLPLFNRLAAKAYRGGLNPEGYVNFHSGLGNVLDEIGGHTYSERGLGKQIGGFMDFMLDPASHRGYHEQFAHHSPLAASLYHAAPGAVAGTVAGGSAGATEGGRENGLGGAIAGGLAGALLGGATGGAASILGYTPGRGTEALGELAEGTTMAKAKPIPPNPISVPEGMNLESLSGKPQRFSADPAKRAWLASHRQQRWADHFGFAPWSGTPSSQARSSAIRPCLRSSIRPTGESASRKDGRHLRSGQGQEDGGGSRAWRDGRADRRKGYSDEGGKAVQART